MTISLKSRALVATGTKHVLDLRASRVEILDALIITRPSPGQRLLERNTPNPNRPKLIVVAATQVFRLLLGRPCSLHEVTIVHSSR